MSYTVTPKLINIEDWSEQDVNPWSQDVAIKDIWRPNAINPQYLLITKESEFIIIDKYGNKVLEKTVDYTLEEARINNNGQVITKSGATIHVYDKDGTEVYTTTFANTVKKVVIGNDYFWVLLNTDPAQIYCYSLSDFSVKSFSYDVYNTAFSDIECGEDGYKAVFAGGNSEPKLLVIFLSFDGEIKSIVIPIMRGAAKNCTRCRPDASLAIIVGGITTGGTDYQSIYVVRSDGAYKQIDNRSLADHKGYQIAIDVNCTKMFFAVGESNTINKRLIDIDTLEVTDAGSFSVSETLESSGWFTSRFGDMTPDGNYILVHSTGSIYIIDWASNVVKKTLTKTVANARISMIPVEVT